MVQLKIYRDTLNQNIRVLRMNVYNQVKSFADSNDNNDVVIVEQVTENSDSTREPPAPVNNDVLTDNKKKTHRF